jgi:hypothetical protein
MVSDGQFLTTDGTDISWGAGSSQQTLVQLANTFYQQQMILTI